MVFSIFQTMKTISQAFSTKIYRKMQNLYEKYNKQITESLLISFLSIFEPIQLHKSITYIDSVVFVFYQSYAIRFFAFKWMLRSIRVSFVLNSKKIGFHSIVLYLIRTRITFFFLNYRHAIPIKHYLTQFAWNNNTKNLLLCNNITMFCSYFYYYWLR